VKAKYNRNYKNDRHPMHIFIFVDNHGQICLKTPPHKASLLWHPLMHPQNGEETIERKEIKMGHFNI